MTETKKLDFDISVHYVMQDGNYRYRSPGIPMCSEYSPEFLCNKLKEACQAIDKLNEEVNKLKENFNAKQ
jgi:hypothetical protein